MADRYPSSGGGVVVAPGRRRGPTRTCIGCRGKFAQEVLLRLRWDGTQVAAELAGARGGGRGAYLCAKMTCWEAARKRHALGGALRLAGQTIDQAALTAALASMITGSPGPPGTVPTAPA